jgi:hypothetical protein
LPIEWLGGHDWKADQAARALLTLEFSVRRLRQKATVAEKRVRLIDVEPLDRGGLVELLG